MVTALRCRRSTAWAVIVGVLGVLAGAGPAPATPAVVGSTWFTSGSATSAGPPGAVVRAYAVGAFTGVAYRLVSAAPAGPQTPRCSVDVAPVNPTTRFASSSGFIATTAGPLDRPPGEWDLCFLDTGGQTTTSPVRYRVEPGPSEVTVDGRRLMVRRRNADATLAPPIPWVMRGVNYSPASPDTNTYPRDPDNVRIRRPELGRWYPTDVPLMAAMNVNTVRLFIDPGVDAADGPMGLRFLDALYAHGMYAVMTVDNAVNDTARLDRVVRHYRDHPAVLMWSLGSEWNINRYFDEATSVADAAARTQHAAGLVKALDANHPVVSSLGDIDLPGAPLATTAQMVADLTNVDVWSLNVYRGPSFGTLFAQWASISTKPMFLGEFGTDAWSSRSGSVDEATQADWNVGLWNHIHRNLSALHPAGTAIGGALFEWNDEWWKVSPPGSQQTGGDDEEKPGHPDGFANEEYFGVVDMARNPRAVHRAFTDAFAPGYAPPPVATAALTARSRGAHAAQWVGQYGSAELLRDGSSFYLRYGGGGGGRGFNVAAIDPVTGDVLGTVENFDTFAGTGAQAMSDFVAAQPDATVLMIAVADEAGINLADSCAPRATASAAQVRATIAALGSRLLDGYCFRYSWSMITVKGQGPLAEALEADTVAVAQATVALG